MARPRPFFSLGLVIGVYVLAVTCVSGAHYRLFVLTGQSNSLGTTAGGEADPTAGRDPADAGVRFYWHNVANASTSLGDSEGAFTTLQDQQGGFYPGSATHWGPEIMFARSIYRAGVREFGIIKASRGGGGNTHWSKAAGGHMYAHVVDTVTAATTALTDAGDTFEIVGLLYLQGESDSSGEAAIADTRLSELITNLRGDLPHAAGMHAVAGGIAAAGTTRDTVRAKQAALAAGDATISYFENLDLQSQLYDKLHFGKAAKLTVGERFAQAFMAAGVVTPSFGNLAFVGDSITHGGAGQASYRYRVFQHLVDRSATFTMVGSVTGAYAFEDVSALTPDRAGRSFRNVHDGHWGWRALWANGEIPLPAGRRSNNRGEGTVLNWTGQAAQYEVDTNGNLVAYPDPAASGTGNTGVTYVPDTVSIMMGINDLAGGAAATRTRDDIARMIDQFRAANPNVRIFVNRVLHTNQLASLQAKVDALNSLLQPMADAKNAALATSPVWIIDASTGFDPVVMTHDNVHPNSAGEVFVGDRIAAGMGLIETPPRTVSTAGPKFEGNEIWDGGFLHGWGELNGSGTTESLVGDGTNLRYDHSGSGTATTLDGSATGWASGSTQDWTFETRIKFHANPSGFALWFGIGGNRVIVELMRDHTRDNGGQSFNVSHNNLDGQFHVFRVVHDSVAGRYHVWRDEARLTPLAGAVYDLAGSDNRMLMGDYTSGGFGNGFDVEIDYVLADQSGGFIPGGADFDGDGMPDVWELEYFGDVVGGRPDDDNDGDGATNLREFISDTDPTSGRSFLRIDGIAGSGSVVEVHVPESSEDRVYQLFGSGDLGVADPWSAVSLMMGGNGGDLVLRDPDATGPVRFYRVEVSLP